MRAHQLVLPPCDVVIKAVADYVRSIPDITDLKTIGKDIFKNSQVWTFQKPFEQSLNVLLHPVIPSTLGNANSEIFTDSNDLALQ